MPLLGRVGRKAQPLAARATSAAPTAGTAVVSIASVPAGKYLAHVWSRVTGADEPAGAKSANLDLRSSANPAATVGGGFSTELVGESGFYGVRPFELTGTSTISVNAVANATAGTTYDVTLLLERIA